MTMAEETQQPNTATGNAGSPAPAVAPATGTPVSKTFDQFRTDWLKTHPEDDAQDDFSRMLGKLKSGADRKLRQLERAEADTPKHTLLASLGDALRALSGLAVASRSKAGIPGAPSTESPYLKSYEKRLEALRGEHAKAQQQYQTALDYRDALRKEREETIRRAYENETARLKAETAHDRQSKYSEYIDAKMVQMALKDEHTRRELDKLDIELKYLEMMKEAELEKAVSEADKMRISADYEARISQAKMGYYNRMGQPKPEPKHVTSEKTTVSKTGRNGKQQGTVTTERTRTYE